MKERRVESRQKNNISYYLYYYYTYNFNKYIYIYITNLIFILFNIIIHNGKYIRVYLPRTTVTLPGKRGRKATLSLLA